MNWTQPMCEPCWDHKNPNRRAVKIKDEVAVPEVCAWCGETTRAGIYVRADPRELWFPKAEDDD